MGRPCWTHGSLGRQGLGERVGVVHTSPASHRHCIIIPQRLHIDEWLTKARNGLSCLRAEIAVLPSIANYVDNNSTPTMSSNLFEVQCFLAWGSCEWSAIPSAPLLYATIVHLSCGYVRQSRLLATRPPPNAVRLWGPQRCVTPKRALRLDVRSSRGWP